MSVLFRCQHISQRLSRQKGELPHSCNNSMMRKAEIKPIPSNAPVKIKVFLKMPSKLLILLVLL